MIGLLLVFLVGIFLLFLIVDNNQRNNIRRQRREIKREKEKEEEEHKEYCADKPYLLNGDCVVSCPMYNTDQKICGYPVADFVTSAISKDGKYKTLITDDGIIVNFKDKEWTVVNKKDVLNNVSKVVMNDTGDKRIILNFNNVYISNDYGATWNLLIPANIKVIDVDMHPDGKIAMIIDRSIPTNFLYNVETYNQDDTLTLVKSFENLVISQISIGKYEQNGISDYFAVVRLSGNKSIDPNSVQDNKCFIIKGFNAAVSGLVNTFLINFYYSFDDVRNKPYDNEEVTHIEISRDGRFIYVITFEKVYNLFPKSYLYTGYVPGIEAGATVNLYRSKTADNKPVENLIYIKSSYYGKNNIGVVSTNTNKYTVVNLDVEYDPNIIVGNPIISKPTLHTNLTNYISTISVSSSKEKESDGKYQLVHMYTGDIFESNSFGNNWEKMK